MFPKILRPLGPNFPYNPTVWYLASTYSCPTPCEDCMVNASPNRDSGIEDSLLDKWLDSVERLEPNYVCLTGGEVMLFPEQIYHVLDRTRNLDVKVAVGTNYLGQSSDEIIFNLDKLKRAGLNTLTTSLDLFHFGSHLPSSSLSYVDYHSFVIEEAVKRFDMVHVGVMYSAENLSETISLTLLVLQKIGAIEFTPNQGGLGPHHINNRPFIISAGPVMRIGRARDKGYGCPIEEEFFCPVAEANDLLFIDLNGVSARCCHAEDGADFGYGNLNDFTIEQIVSRIQASPLLDSSFLERIAVANNLMKSDFPTSLPVDGAKIACEVCSPMAKNPEIKAKLSEEPLFDGCF